jgi:hypothetical protein
MSQTSPVSETAIFECREFREDAFRSMEVQICGETKTVQFCVEDHGGDHLTAPAVAINWANAIDLANWVLSHTSGVAQCQREPGEEHPVLKQADELHDLGFKAGWDAALAQRPAGLIHPDVLMNVVQAKINDYVEQHGRGDLTELGDHGWLVLINLQRDMEIALSQSSPEGNSHE